MKNTKNFLSASVALAALFFVSANVSAIGYILKNISGETIEFVENNYEPITNIDEFVKKNHFAIQQLSDKNESVSPIKPKSQLFVRRVGGRFGDISYLLKRIVEQQPYHQDQIAKIILYPSGPNLNAIDSELSWK
jgi:hypothetical protein